MTLDTILRRTGLVVAALVLLFLTWNGIRGGIGQLPESETLGQRAQSVTQVLYGVLALLSLVTAFRGRHWGPLVQGSWVVTVALAAGLASVFWGDTSIQIGLAAGAATLLVALVIVWLLRVGVRGPTRHPVSGRST